MSGATKIRGEGSGHKDFSWGQCGTAAHAPKGQQAACNHRAEQPGPHTTHQTMPIGAQGPSSEVTACDPPPQTEALGAGLTRAAEP